MLLDVMWVACHYPEVAFLHADEYFGEFAFQDFPCDSVEFLLMLVADPSMRQDLLVAPCDELVVPLAQGEYQAHSHNLEVEESILENIHLYAEDVA